MSSTNRGGQRVEADFYPTPAWCVRRLLEATELPGGLWLEPCAGDGAIIRAANEVRQDVSWLAVELRPECRALLQPLTLPGGLRIGDIASGELWAKESGPAVAITNPPFSLAAEVIDTCLRVAPVVVMLLRLNYVASAKRAAFMRETAPDIFVLPNRPSFTGTGTDSNDYAWFIWREERLRTAGKITVLSTTSLPERRADSRRP